MTMFVIAWPEAEDEYRIVEMQLPELPSEREARAQAMRDTGELLTHSLRNTVLMVYQTMQSTTLSPRSSEKKTQRS